MVRQNVRAAKRGKAASTRQHRKIVRQKKKKKSRLVKNLISKMHSSRARSGCCQKASTRYHIWIRQMNAEGHRFSTTTSERCITAAATTRTGFSSLGTAEAKREPRGTKTGAPSPPASRTNRQPEQYVRFDKSYYMYHTRSSFFAFSNVNDRTVRDVRHGERTRTEEKKKETQNACISNSCTMYRLRNT